MRFVPLAEQYQGTRVLIPPPTMDALVFFYENIFCDAAGSLDANSSQAYDDTVRELERGSIIISVCPNDIKVVLQVILFGFGLSKGIRRSCGFFDTDHFFF